VRKLPVLATVADAWRELRHDWRIFARLSIAPFAIQLVGNALLVIGADGAIEKASRGWGVVRLLAYSIVLWLALVPAITAWHRHVVLGPEARPPRPEYQFGSGERIYVGKSVLILVVLMLLSIPLSIPTGVVAAAIGAASGSLAELERFAPLLSAMVWITTVVMSLICAPWLLIFPAAALNRSLRLRDAAALARGNRLRLLAVLALAYLPQLVISAVLRGIVELVAGEDAAQALVPALVAQLLEMTTQYALLAVAVGALSFAYLRLGGARAASPE
jgi:hypothetical protein